ncbi:stalk domain-containing protein [Paenibacillus massiliensis]|uniref:stalk domain-containing protein n=1 Tax=Paenibacillus massiliensis TaxID=225917 RepID=UPI0003F7A4D5|nr:stalk domain-containing protein [Paenibacillus massiliensis]
MKKLSTFIAGTVFGIVLATASVAGASTYLKATQLTIKVYVDGKEAKLSEKPISVNGRSYLPVRDTANALGYSVASATGSKIELVQGGVSINSSSTPSTSQTTTIKNETTSTKIGGSKVANLEQTYAKGDKLDAERISVDIASGKIDLNVQDSNSGKSLLMLVIEKDDFETYKVIRRNALNPNLQDNNGDAALHYAANFKNIFYIGALIDMNADAAIKNKNGKRPIDLLQKSNSGWPELRIYMINTGTAN